MMRNNRIFLRKIQIDDIEILRNLRNKERVRTAFIDSDIIDYNAQMEWYKHYKIKNNDIIFAICKRDNSKIIGFLSLYNIDMIDKCAEFGRFMIDDGFLGSGYAYEAMLYIVKYSHDILGLNCLKLVVKKKNLIAYNCYKKSGFFIYKQDDEFFYMKKLL